MDEATLLRRLTTQLSRASQAGRSPAKSALFDPHYVGPGDDAAILGTHNNRAQVLCCDQLVEDQDFRRRWASPADVGHKAAAINLSDLAAMGAKPRALLASLAVPPSLSAREVIALMRAMDQCGRTYGAPVVGGDLSRTTGPLVVSVTALGEQVAPPLLRHRAQLGDIVAVAGRLGGAATGLIELERLPRGARAHARLRTSQAARWQLRPRPQVALGLALARARCTRSAADISDGLVRDVRLLLPPKLGVCLEARRLPLMRGVTDVALAATGGEDFVLVLAIAPDDWTRARGAAARVGERLYPVGWVVHARRGREVHWVDAPHLPVTGGFDHFRARS